MNDNNIPEEELNFGSFSINDITKTVESAKSNAYQEEESNVTESANVLTADDVKAVTNNEKFDAFVESNETDVPDLLEQEASSNDEPSYDDAVYAAAIELAKENGLLNIPDDIGEINADVWQDILSQNESERERRVLNKIRSNAGDPKIAELLDFVMEGGTWYGFNEMQSTIQDEIDINSLDHTQEEDQRYLLELYLSDGLDENNPAHARRLQNIPNEVNNIFERLEQDQVAEEAKSFLLSKTEAEKEYIKQQQELYVQEENRKIEAQRQARQQWNEQFKSTLNNKNWSQNKKDQIVSQFDIVQLDNGKEMEMWQYKFDNIWRSPGLTQIFMDFLSDLDPNTLQFKTHGQTVKKQVTNTIQSLLNKKQQTRTNSRYTSNKRTGNQISGPAIDPHNY